MMLTLATNKSFFEKPKRIFDMLRYLQVFLVSVCIAGIHAHRSECFLAGDVRANEQVPHSPHVIPSPQFSVDTVTGCGLPFLLLGLPLLLLCLISLSTGWTDSHAHTATQRAQPSGKGVKSPQLSLGPGGHLSGDSQVSFSLLIHSSPVPTSLLHFSSIEC